jgi:hypothetical protein
MCWKEAEIDELLQILYPCEVCTHDFPSLAQGKAIP